MGRPRADYPRHIRRRLIDGTFKDYYYDRKTGKPVPAPDGSGDAPEGRRPRVDARWGVTAGPEMSIAKLVAQFQASAEWLKLAAATQELYDRTLNRPELAPLMRLKVAELTTERVQLVRTAIAERGIAKHGRHYTGAANVFLQSIGALYAWGRQNRAIGELYPTRSTRHYPVQRGHVPWTDYDIERALTMPEPIARGVRLAHATALRIGDLIRLTWNDWDGHALRVAPMKTRRFRQQIMLPLSEPWPDRFATWRADRPLEMIGAVTILTRADGTPWPDVNSFDRAFAAARTRIGLRPECSMHGLRATAATRLIELGMPIRSVMALTGHTSEKSFAAYVRYADQQLLVLPAAEALGKLSRRFS